MKLNIYKLVAPTAMVMVLSLTSCSDWTDTESLNIHQPSIEEQNPELYAQYIKALNDYKNDEHQITIVSVNNLSTPPTSRNQHLTNLPDSVDYICLNNPAAVSDANKAEIGEVRIKGTKVLGLMDFDAIESNWKAILEEEKNDTEAGDESDQAPDENEEADEAARFIEYCKSEAAKQAAACKALDLDGLVANFTGFDLNVLADEAEIAAETARQAAFFDAVATVSTGNGKTLIVKGAPQNMIDKSILANSKYIIVNAHSAKNPYEMSYFMLMACAKDVPTNRLVIGVTTPYLTNSGAYNGNLGDGSSAITGAAEWAVQVSADYRKAGISIDGAEADYFNIDKIYPNVREAINIMNPTLK